MAEVDAQTIRDATEARIGAEQAQETAEEAQRAAQWTEEDLADIREQLGRLDERVTDQEVVLGGVITYLAEEEEPEPAPEPAHTEVDQRQGSKPEDREPPSEPEADRHTCGTLW